MLFRAKAPLRVSFAGGGTDVPPFPEREGGLVLNATINRYAYGTLRPRDDDQIMIESADFDVEEQYDRDAPLVFDGKLDLVKAGIRRLEGEEHRGFDLFLRSNAPPGSGLGSSSTLMVTLIGLLKDFLPLPLTDYEIAHLSYVVERVEAGISGGLQDQYAATFGGFNFIEFERERVIVNPLRIRPEIVNELEHNLLLAYTGATRRSDGIIADQTARYEASEAETLAGLRQQKEFAVEMKNALLQGRPRAFGELLHEAWEAKKKLSPRITTSFIDELYSVARKHGAIGGKVTGAGGGGYMLFYCEFQKRHRVEAALARAGAQVSEFAFEPSGLETWSVPE